MVDSELALPAFRGYIGDTLDALLIFEGCRRGVLYRVQGRLSDAQRKDIKSGDVYVFSEEESKIRRWTDGRRWSPSRIMANFLIYRELEGEEPRHKPASARMVEDSLSLERAPWPQEEELDIKPDLDPLASPYSDDEAANSLIKSLPGNHSSGRFKENGLIKKTISIAGLHMISYYLARDVANHTLSLPSSHPDIAAFKIDHHFLMAQYFRHPPQVSFGEDGLPTFAGLTDDEPMVRRVSHRPRRRRDRSEMQTWNSARQPSGQGRSVESDCMPSSIGVQHGAGVTSHTTPTSVSATVAEASAQAQKLPTTSAAQAPSAQNANGTTAVTSANDSRRSSRSSIGGYRSSTTDPVRHEPYRIPTGRPNSSCSSHHDAQSLTSPFIYGHPAVGTDDPYYGQQYIATGSLYTPPISRQYRSPSYSSFQGSPAMQAGSCHAVYTATPPTSAGYPSPYFPFPHGAAARPPDIIDDEYREQEVAGGVPVSYGRDEDMRPMTMSDNTRSRPDLSICTDTYNPAYYPTYYPSSMVPSLVSYPPQNDAQHRSRLASVSSTASAPLPRDAYTSSVAHRYSVSSLQASTPASSVNLDQSASSASVYDPTHQSYHLHTPGMFAIPQLEHPTLPVHLQGPNRYYIGGEIVTSPSSSFAHSTRPTPVQESLNAYRQPRIISAFPPTSASAPSTMESHLRQQPLLLTRTAHSPLMPHSAAYSHSPSLPVIQQSPVDAAFGQQVSDAYSVNTGTAPPPYASRVDTPTCSNIGKTQSPLGRPLSAIMSETPAPSTFLEFPSS